VQPQSFKFSWFCGKYVLPRLSTFLYSLAGADVIFAPVGGFLFDEALKCAAPWGAQYLVIGFASGSIPKVGRALHGHFL
jgi:NADPH:quinone reductase-like Zn-dependent oxidoreductase